MTSVAQEPPSAQIRRYRSGTSVPDRPGKASSTVRPTSGLVAIPRMRSPAGFEPEKTSRSGGSSRYRWMAIGDESTIDRKRDSDSRRRSSAARRSWTSERSPEIARRSSAVA